MEKEKGHKKACNIQINERGNFDIVTPCGKIIPMIIDVNIDQDVDNAHRGVALATIKMWVNPVNE